MEAFYPATSFPVHFDIGFQLPKEDEIFNHSEFLKESVERTNTLTGSIKDKGNGLLEHLNEVQGLSQVVEKQIREATSIVESIQRNVSYLNILALNASIESARAGQAGKGVAVVADEMGKFSKMSGDSAKQSNETLKGIVHSLNQVKDTVIKSTDFATTQVEVVNEIMDEYTKVISVSEELTELSKEHLK